MLRIYEMNILLYQDSAFNNFSLSLQSSLFSSNGLREPIKICSHEINAKKNV